jgi:hypothetical protein
VPGVITMPAIPDKGRIPAVGHGASPALAKGGETEGATASPPSATTTWPATRSATTTSRVTRLRIAAGGGDRRAARPGGEEFCRQLAWRDLFYP